jgi:cytochrome o ubiquinol oxidase operon protein cyoD
MSHEAERNIDDVGPGFLGSSESVREGVFGYLIGLLLAVLLTAASFGTVYTDLIWQPAIPVALVTLAVAQIGVHLVFFLHLTTAPDNTNNALALAFGVLIVALVIGGSLWIMQHLNQNMMPMPHMA